MTQLGLFDARPLARRRDPHTSHEAAGNAVNFVASHEGRIFNALFEAGETGLTHKEIAAITRMEPVQVARRLAGLEARRLIARRLLEHGKYEARDGCAVWRKA